MVGLRTLNHAQDVDLRRRTLMGGAAAGLVAAELGAMSAADAAVDATARPGGTGSPFKRLEPIGQIRAGDLNMGYYEAGPANGIPVVLLHGWPYDIHTYVDVVPLLVSAGHRVIVPHLRGYGTTRFLSSSTPRNGQPSALAVDTIALMNALGIDKATIAGCDWGARTANIVAALWPERCLGQFR